MKRDKERVINRRDHLRMQVNAEVRFGVESEAAEGRGVTTNLSASGILFETQQALTEGQYLDLEVLPRPGSRIPPLRARVEVLRVTQQCAGRYEVAGEFREVE